MRRLLIGCALLALFVAVSGCTSVAAFHPYPNAVVDIVLKENDFKTVNTHLVGEAQCAYVIGIPLGEPEITTKALNQIRDKATMDGRSVVLVNFTRDNLTVMDLGVYWIEKIIVTADVIEFTK